jgi:dolichol kinase
LRTPGPSDGHPLTPIQGSGDLAREIYQLLRDLDPNRWRDEQERALRGRLQALSLRVEALRGEVGLLADQATAEMQPRLLALAERLREMARVIAARAPEAELPLERLRFAWADFRREATPAYEHLAASLQPLDVRLPSLRPSKLPRAFFHVATGATAIAVVQHLVDGIAVPLAGLLAFTAIWSVEIGRRLIPGMNDLCMRLMGSMSHPHERHRVTSSSWYAVAIGLLALPADERLFTVAMAVVGVGDPAAGLIGRRFGRHRLQNGRSVEGSLGFIAVSVLAVIALLAVYYPALPHGQAALLAIAASIPAALAELFIRRWDDNLTVPVAAAGGYWLAAVALGL